MEILNTLYNLMGLVFVLGTIISMGLSLTIAQITGPLRNVRFVIVALLANFVVPPILASILIQVFSLDETLAVGLLLVSLAAGAPALPKTAVFAKVDTAAATGLMVLLVVVTIVVLPLALPLLLTGISVTFWDIASGLVYLILIPLAVSLFVRARYPDAAGSAQPLFAQASNLSLLILMVLMVVLNFNNVVGLLGSGGLLASLILVVLTTAGGYLLGKLGKAGDWVQALGAGQRNIAAAMVVATMNFGNDEVVMVVVYSLIGMIVIVPLALELGKRAKPLKQKGKQTKRRS
ncbi:MAG TPA: bile acid:sodium symporter family protein [Anaerolineae bacterium]|nr:bile acid:sodium symporter family protein [Anaerolineae bacterium]